MQGSVFLGAYASEPLGDYVGGNEPRITTKVVQHASSPLGVYDFVKRTSFTQFTKERLEEVATHITTLSSYRRVLKHLKLRF